MITSMLTRACLLLACIIKHLHCHPHHDQPSPQNNIPKLIIVSFDGFRWDYLDIVKEQGLQTPNFDRMMLEGASVAGGLKNVFITKTFPNHYSIVTGRYEDEHGMVANNFFDPQFNESFEITSDDAKDLKWWDGKSGIAVEPIWKVNERCGCKETCECDRKSGSIFWPGSDVTDLHPTYFFKYNNSMPFKQRVKKLIEWFTQHDHPINFGLLYFNEPDFTGHEFGPLMPETAIKITELDTILGYLLSLLEKNHLINTTNLIVTSDHGMLSQDHYIYLDDHINTTLFTIYSSSPVFHVIPKPGKLSEVYKALKGMDNVDVYMKEDIPPQYHYQHNRRIPPIVLASHPRYALCVSRQFCVIQKGDHGYNNSIPSMHPIFVARGPSFKTHFSLNTQVSNVDLYPLMATLLKLPIPPSSGDMSRVVALLDPSVLPASALGEDILFITVMLLILSVSLVFSACACQHHCKYFSGSYKSTKTTLFTSIKPPDAEEHLLVGDDDDEDDDVM